MADAPLSSNHLCERLRKRLITIPKPGSKPFEPSYPIVGTWTTNEDHKPGDSAGIQMVNVNLGAASSVPDKFMAQEHVYAKAQLEWDAADEIDRLAARVAELEDQAKFNATMFHERNAEIERNVALEAERDLLRAALRDLVPEGWDDGTMDHMPGIKAARPLLARARDETKESPSPDCGVTAVADGFEAAMRVDITSDDPAKVAQARQILGDFVLDPPADFEMPDVMVTVTHVPIVT